MSPARSDAMPVPALLSPAAAVPALCAAFAVATLLIWGQARTSTELPAACMAQDRAATARVASLVQDGSTTGMQRLEVAVRDLANARRRCRMGGPEAAAQSYRVIEARIAAAG